MKINKKNCHARHAPKVTFIKLKIFRSERRRRNKQDNQHHDASFYVALVSCNFHFFCLFHKNGRPLFSPLRVRVRFYVFVKLKLHTYGQLFNLHAVLGKSVHVLTMTPRYSWNTAKLALNTNQSIVLLNVPLSNDE